MEEHTIYSSKHELIRSPIYTTKVPNLIQNYVNLRTHSILRRTRNALAQRKEKSGSQQRRSIQIQQKLGWLKKKKIKNTASCTRGRHPPPGPRERPGHLVGDERRAAEWAGPIVMVHPVVKAPMVEDVVACWWGDAPRRHHGGRRNFGRWCCSSCCVGAACGGSGREVLVPEIQQVTEGDSVEGQILPRPTKDGPDLTRGELIQRGGPTMDVVLDSSPALENRSLVLRQIRPEESQIRSEENQTRRVPSVRLSGHRRPVPARWAQWQDG